MSKIVYHNYDQSIELFVGENCIIIDDPFTIAYKDWEKFIFGGIVVANNYTFIHENNTIIVINNLTGCKNVIVQPDRFISGLRSALRELYCQ